MARRLVLVTLAATAVLTAAIGGLLIWRVPIAQSLVDWAAKDLEIPGAQATVERIAADQVRIVDLAAGDLAEFTVDSVEVDFRTPDFAKGQIDRITAVGLTLNLDLREGAEPFGSLQPLLDRLRDNDASNAGAKRLPANLPDVQFSAGRIEAQTPYGPASIAFDGALTGNQEGNPVLKLQGDLTSALARLTAELSVSGDPQKEPS